MGAPRSELLARLTDQIFDTIMAWSPVEASLHGDRRFDAALPDVSPAGLRNFAAALERLTVEIARLDDADLSVADKVTRDIAVHVLSQMRHEIDGRYVQFAAGPTTSGATISSAASSLLAGLPKLRLADAAAADAYIERCAAVPSYLDAAEAQLAHGVHSGRIPVRRLVAATVRQIDRYLSAPAGHDPLLLDAPDGWDGAGAWRQRLASTVTGTVRPAFARHRTALAERVAPHARSDDQPGLCWLPDGDAIYRDAVTLHTTTSLAPEDLHQLGLDLIDDLAGEYRVLGKRVLATDDLGQIFPRLRDDPALRFTSSADIRDTAVVALARAQAAVGTWFDTLPSAPCEVREIPLVEAPESTIAYYQPPPLDGSRPGVYYVNTTEPHTRSRFDAEVLAFHESVPGHHLQIALAIEADLPALQRVVYLTAFVEGWGLYIERLADEMGLYTDDLARLGMLSFDSWRACRLVVDTGIHAFGWSRSRAVDFFREHSPQPHANVENEIDRYIGWPGQALAYMVGRTRIADLRRRAETALGQDFDIAAFHDAVLAQAAVPLGTLERLVDDWIATHHSVTAT